jgi:hypothetical protein
MNSKAQGYIDEGGLSREAVEQIACMLPEDDAELDNWISEAVRESNPVGFMLIVLAALSRERPVHARHLVGGARLVGVVTYLPAIALRMQGDVAEYLLEGMRNTAMYHWTEAAGLLSVIVWCDEHRGGIYPDQVLSQARALAQRV